MVSGSASLARSTISSKSEKDVAQATTDLRKALGVAAECCCEPFWSAPRAGDH